MSGINGLSSDFNISFQTAVADKVVTKAELDRLKSKATTEDDKKVVELIEKSPKDNIKFEVGTGDQKVNYELKFVEEESTEQTNTEKTENQDNTQITKEEAVDKIKKEPSMDDERRKILLKEIKNLPTPDLVFVCNKLREFLEFMAYTSNNYAFGNPNNVSLKSVSFMIEDLMQMARKRLAEENDKNSSQRMNG
ncbi:MAG: hypothetical protein U0457_04720 [Candidatus Sericytochromatia bacterium]